MPGKPPLPPPDPGTAVVAPRKAVTAPVPSTVSPVLDTLLGEACPSIRSRLLLEVLGRRRDDPEVARLQPAILDEPLVQEVLSWQQPDGWLAWDFHGTRSTEAGVRVLCEKGVDPAHPAVRRALEAIERHPERLDRGFGKAGRAADEMGLGGPELIRAAIFAYAGAEDRPFVREQIGGSIEALRGVPAVESIDGITTPYRGYRVYRPGVKWPCVYHLRLLAFTHVWRTPANTDLVARACRRLTELSPLPAIHVRAGSQVVAPASFAMHDFRTDLDALDAPGWMMWFHRLELLARLGVVPLVPEFARQVGQLASMLEGGWFRRPLAHPSFGHWGAYTGLALEPDWRSPARRVRDLTFRSLLIQHYSSPVALSESP